MASRVQGPFKGPGSLGGGGGRGVNALSCYLSLIFKHSDTKWDLKKRNLVDQILVEHVPTAPPSRSATELSRGNYPDTLSVNFSCQCIL